MAIPTSTYPVTRPTVSGTEITVDLYSKAPLLMLRTVMSLRQADYWLSDLMFSSGGSSASGAVVYQPVTALDDAFPSRDVEDVAPGASFPEVGVSNIGAVAAYTQKRGFKMKVTREMRTRNDISKFRNNTTAMYNACARRSDTKAMAAVNAASVLSAAQSAAWSVSTTAIRNDIESARHTVENSQLGKTEGYRVNTLVLGSNQWLNIRLNDKLMDSLKYVPGLQGDAAALVNNGVMDGLLGIPRVRLNPWIGADERWLFDGSRVGKSVTEYPLELQTWNEPENQVDWFQLSESDVFVIEAPKALIKIV